MKGKIIIAIQLVGALGLGCPPSAMAQRSVTVVKIDQKTPLSKALKLIESKTGYKMIFNYEDIKNYTVQEPVVGSQVNELLNQVLTDKPLTYLIDGQFVTIKRSNKMMRNMKVREKKTHTVSGHVFDQGQLALPGATIRTDDGQTIITGDDGRFTIEVPRDKKTVLTVSYIGMKTRTITIDRNVSKEIYITLQDDAKIDEVVVNGMFEQKKSSFTGSTTNFNREQLKEVGNQNLLKSLKNLDPSFQIMENLETGSNPNSMPDIQLRGQTSFNIQGTYNGNQNQPLFILDGFETTLEKINDLDMNRIQSVTLLKDAAAKAIYGSKAGNGVVVIQTIRPKSGEMRITYNGDLNIEAPDLTGYNLMNAQEKFDWEVQHGKYANWQSMKDPQYGDNLYKSVYDALASGVDTYWLSKPLHTGIGQKHTLQLEGGDSKVRYILGASYNNVTGVMKGSSRNTLDINSTLSYSYKNMVFRNELDYTRNVSKNSPYGNFSDYVTLEPYFAPYDENGQLKKILGYECVNNTYPVYNPLYNASLNTKDQTDYTAFVENFEWDWHINENLRINGKFSYSRTTRGADIFYPANHTMFAEYDTNGQSDRKGRYTKTNGSTDNLSAQAGLSWNKEWHKHYLFLNGTWNLQTMTDKSTTMVAEGFGNDNMDDISMATYYLHDSHPTGTDSKTREIGLVAALNYSYDERYLFDASYRATGSSVYGSDNHWGGFWSLGAGWNINKEKWIPKEWNINLLKLRYSLGYSGTQNFNPYQARATYYYNGRYYDGRMGTILKGMPNTKLKWQKVLDHNLGLDLAVGRWLTLRAEYYVQNTDNMLTDITLPGSTGFQTYKENMGEIQNKGFELAFGLTPWRDNEHRGWLTFTASATRNKNQIKKIYDIFRKSNDDADAALNGELPNDHQPTEAEIAAYKLNATKPATKYYEGCSMTAIWGVRSLGIDPINGKEMFLDKNGNVTYTWSSDDQVVIGDSNPKLHGTFGVNAGWHGWTLSAVASYKLGGDLYNSTLIDRVENVNGFGNLDKRVSETWTTVGENALYKSITMGQNPNQVISITHPTSRFIQRNNELYLSNVTLGYDFYEMNWLRKAGLERLRLSFSANDLLRLSSVKIERGTSYPYARTFSFSVSATF